LAQPSRFPALSGKQWKSSVSVAINGRGQIVGWNRNGSRVTSFLPMRSMTAVKSSADSWTRPVRSTPLSGRFPGVGPIVAAQLIVAWSHPGRLRSEACFARLAGVAPIPASSGQTTRHRLSRGGDRPLNRALHTIVLHRRQHDPATRDYIARRIAEGKSRRDATRLLKRYLARHLYRLLQQQKPMIA
jgi:Transposase IS116/IS110/IS902 family